MTEKRRPLLTSTTSNNGGFFQRWSRDPGRWRARFNLFVFAVILIGTITAAQVLDWPADTNLTVKQGQPISVDVRAPRPITYQSEVLTQDARDRAAAGIQPIFDPPETRVARQQVTRAAEILDFMALIRDGPYAAQDQKIEWLMTIADLPLAEVVAREILSIENGRWETISNEVLRVLDRAMRQEIREGELASAKRNIPNLIAFGLNEGESAVITAIIQGLLRPNAFYNAERTDAAREANAAAVEPIERTIAAGETIIREGDRLNAADIEALDALGLLQVERNWQDYVSAIALAALLTGTLAAFASARRRAFWHENLRVYLLAAIVGIFVLLAKTMAPLDTVLPYLFPLAAMAMLIGALIDLPIAIFSTLIISLLVGLFTAGNMELITYSAMGAVAGALALGRAERLNSFVRAGGWVVVTNWLVLAIFRLPLLQISDNRTLLEPTFAAMVNGIIAASFTLVFFYMLGQVFGMTTSLQLLELSRPNHPLLRQLLLKSPGTYHHTLLVGNMAEEACTAVEADALLARVGSYYHDIGKTMRPYFFIENNTDGVNPHDRLDPYTSARIIISHVIDGVELAEKYRLPEAIIDFIREHHGTTRVEYFYHQACQEQESSEEVDENAFCYSGPRPRSRETAILMLADGCEATVRAVGPSSREEMMELVRSVINRRLMSGQLDESQLTLQDLSQITEAFARVLQGIHHPRVKYPGEQKAKSPASQKSQPAAGAAKPVAAA